MSIPYGLAKQNTQDLIDDYSSATAAKILRAYNLAYRTIAGDHVWQVFFTELSNPGTTLPADMERPVMYVQDDTDYLYSPVAFTDRYIDPRLYKWFPNGTVQTPLATASDGVVTANSTAFTSASASFASATHANEYIQIGTNEGIYKISSVTDPNTLVLADAYRGASATAQYYEIQPRGTQKIAYVDQEGATLTPSSSAKLWYQRRPLPLYNDRDQILLPGNCEAVQIMVHQMMMLGDKYDNDALKRRDDYNAAIARMQPLNLTVGRRRRVRNRMDGVVKYGRDKRRFNVDSNDRIRPGW
ncbi:MAG: hypothetical protein ACYTEQ_00735 [Planctomycetota bacterium]